jgi:DNA segregation ATPase FtsK/SpoIIIE-like protein
MNERAHQGSIRNVLDRHHRTVRRAHALYAGVRGAALAVVPLTLATLAGVLATLGVGAAWVRLALLGGALLLTLFWTVRRFLRRAPAFDRFLETAESRFPDLRSWLRNAVDFSASSDEANGTSSQLAHAVLDETVRRVDRLPFAELKPAVRPRQPALVLAGCLAVLAIAAFATPGRFERSWRTLWNPELAAPPVTLSVEPGSVKVTPGASLAVYARVQGTDRRPRLSRSHGPAVEGIADGQSPDGRLWRFDLAQLTREDDYQVRVAATESPRYHIGMAGEPVPVSFEVEYQSPAYARLPVQRGSALRGDLAALRGSRAKVTVTFDRDLQRLEATTGSNAPAAWTALTARRWHGELPVSSNGDYELHAVASQGEGRFRYRISALGDAPPVLAVRVPTGDVDLPAGQQVPVELVGQDDLGLTELKLEFRRDPSEPWAEVPLAGFPARPREAEVRARWDASPLGLLPGQTAVFRFVLFDDNAIGGRGRAESPTFELRFPSLAELYEDIDQSQGRVQKSLEKVADQSRELQKSLDQLSRQRPQRAAPQQPAFERSEELKRSLERQQELAKQLEDASKELRESLAKAEEREAFNEELADRLREMAQLMDQVQSKEFRDAMKRMQEALEKLDRQALENQLPQWRQENQEMLKNLERTIELLKQLREEEQLQALAQRAEELKAMQDQLNREHEAQAQEQKDSKSQDASTKSEEASKLGDKQEEAAKETEKLASDVEEMAGQQGDNNGQQQMQEMSEQLSQEAAQPQRESAESARKQERAQALQKGQQASQALQQAAQRMRSLTAQSQAQRQQLDTAAIRRAAQDLLSLQRESEGNLKDQQPMSQRANRSTDLSEGVARVADSLTTLSETNPFLSPELGEALGRAMNQLSQSGKDFGAGNRARGDQLGQEAGSALNEAVLELRAAEQSMCKMPGQGEGQQQGTGQQMADVGQQQQQLNQRSKGLAQRLSQQMRLSTGDQSELERLAQEQSRLREQLQQIQKDDRDRRELLGRLDAAEREMKEVEEALRSGSLGGDLEEKQTRILSRLLDAQRSVNRRDFDPERESRPGEEFTRTSAPELPADLLRETDRLRLDMLRAESDRYPAQYRTYIEAYLRSLNGIRR